jgi:hypothetical protein
MKTQSLRFNLTHFVMLAIELSLLVFFFSKYPSDIIKITAEQSCSYYDLTGYYCSTCGMTRSIMAFFTGNFTLSWQFNYIGFFASTLFSLEVMMRVLLCFTSRFKRFHFYYFISALIFIFLSSVWRWLSLNFF